MSTIFLADAGGSQTQGILMIVVYIAIFGAIMYFMVFKPQKKEQNRVKSMLADLAVGDCILTTSGFYGIILDIQDDTVIVEFGNNKNCRIPMQKSAIAQVEKAGAE
ncbi:MAG: preprotein translocase subunit YajC [Lachnospiraceae bacterium]|nr:preprotein translocase subunit YajC [Lachnospiraceae bacterium]